MTAKQLTDSILQMAIQGKLVPQDPNDEPASVLLDKIHKEKAKLVKEGKLKKKDLEETPISEDEKPFDIPESWVWVRLKEITSYRRGSFPQPYTDLTSYGGPNSMPFVQVADVDEVFYRLKNETKKTISQKAMPFSVFVPQGTVVVTLQGSIGKVAITQYDSYVDRTLAIFHRIYGQIDKMYFSIVLKNKFENEALHARGATIKTITKEEFQSFVLPLPPLAEQRRIVERIEEYLPIIKEYGEAYEEASKMDTELPDKLKKSILQEAIMGKLGTQDPSDAPASSLLNDIRAEKQKLVEDKILKKKDLEEIAVEEDEIPQQIIEGWEYVKLPFVTSLIDGTKREGEFVCLDAKFLRGKSAGEKLSKGKFVHQNDNIILVDGENSGEVFTVPCDGYMGSTFKQLWVTGVLYLPYVLYFIKANKDLLRNSKKGAAIPHLNKDVFYNLVIGIPPLAEQHRIVHKIEELYAEIDNMTVENNININEIEVTDNE